MAPENSMTPRSPQESALLRTALHRFPGGVLGGYYAPDDLQFMVKEARGAHLSTSPGASTSTTSWAAGPSCSDTPIPPSSPPSRSSSGRARPTSSSPSRRWPSPRRSAGPCRAPSRCATARRAAEATFFAFRVCRAFRKRDKILKFEGGFHGTHDYSLMSVGPRAPKAFPAPTPDSAGIPHAIQRRGADRAIQRPARGGSDDRGAPREPGRRHHGAVPAARRAGAGLSRGRPGGDAAATACPSSSTRSSRASASPMAGAQEYYGVVPDIAALGKVIGGGFPLAAVVGSEDIMRHLAPDLEARASSCSRRGRSTATRSPPPPGWPPSPSCGSRGPMPASSRRAAGSRTGSQDAARAPASPRRWRARRRCSRSTSRTAPSPTTAPASPPTARGMPRSPGRCSSAAWSRPPGKIYVSLAHG